MATVNCPECGEEVIDHAFLCPVCDARLIKREGSFFAKIFKWIFIIFNVFMILALYGAMDIDGKMGIEENSIFFGLWVFVDIAFGILFFVTNSKE